jgi:maleate cis-trans isomerase
VAIGDNFLPLRKIGCLVPFSLIDNGPYEFYRIAPERVMRVMIPMGLGEFSTQDVERVFQPVDELAGQLRERGVDIIVQMGVPLDLMLGREALKQMLVRIEQVAGVTALGEVQCVVEAARALGIKKIVVANKWKEAMNERLAEFFAEAGITQTGTRVQSMVPAEFMKMSLDEGLSMAYGLGRAALEAHPEADGLFIGGGAWLTLPVITVLEQEFGKPVITNQTAAVWDTCRRVNYWQPKSGYGRLIALP